MWFFSFSYQLLTSPLSPAPPTSDQPPDLPLIEPLLYTFKDESGSITFKELNKALRRSPAAEAARAAKRAAARAARDSYEQPEDLFELGELRGNAKTYVRDVADTADKEERVLKGLAAAHGNLSGELRAERTRSRGACGIASPILRVADASLLFPLTLLSSYSHLTLTSSHSPPTLLRFSSDPV